MDIHPVAVIIARITYLLALGTDTLQARRGGVDIPVYLGDALQWSVKPMLGGEDLEVYVAPPLKESRTETSKKHESETVLRFPVAVAEDPNLFGSIIAELLQASERATRASDVEATLGRR
jgi:hypothetical protein